MPAVAALLLIPWAYAQGPSNAPAIVTENCSGCHGMDGNSQLPYFPRLAGLTPDYAHRKLANFRATAPPPVDELFSRIAHIRSVSKDTGITPEATAYMVGIAHAVSDADSKASAQWYAAQRPAQGRSGNRKLVEEGRSLFMNGRRSQGLPACKTCHGREAQGTAIAPRLAGQNAAYVIHQLALFRAGDRQHSPEMTNVAQNVEGEQARAVATYLQSL